MVAVTADKVVVELEAKLGRYNANVKGAERQWQNSMTVIRREGGRTETAIAAAMSRIRGSTVLGLGALAIGAKQVTDLADKFTRFENRLKTAGVEGDRLATVGDRLFEIANKNGVEIEALGSVYARASLASKELGADQQQLDTFVSAVSDALRVQGSSAEASRGALLQLSQALGQDVVRAEEFNSILEGALPIAQAAARGIDRFEGSVAKLRSAIIEGEVTSREFFEGILKDAPNLAGQAAKANLTLENSFTALYNQLARGIGQTNNALGASERLSEGILYLADNLGTLGEALGVITAAVGSRYVASLVAAGAAQAAFYTKALSGNVIIIEGARAAEQRALSTLNAARADEQAAIAALAKAKQVHASAVVSAEDANAQFARAAATKQLSILEAQATAATAARTAAETAHAAALTRTTVASRAAAVAQRAYAALSGFVGGPLGIALTGLAATYLIVANRTAAAEARTKALQEELRNLGYLAPDVADGIEDAADAFNKLADDQLRDRLKDAQARLKELTSGGAFAGLASIFNPDNIPVDEVASLARQWGAANVIATEVSDEIQSIAEGIRSGTIESDELDMRLKAIAKLNLGSGVDGLVASLRNSAKEASALLRFIEKVQKTLGITPAKTEDPRAGTMASRASRRKEQDKTDAFISETRRVAGLSEDERNIEKRAEALLKEAKAAKAVLSEEQALALAREEFAGKSASAEAERAAKDFEQARQAIADLQREIEIFGDERQQAIDAAVRSLPAGATADQIAKAKEYAATLYDLTEQRRIDAIVNSDASAGAIQNMKDESAQLGIVGAALAELQFKQQRYNNLRSEGIPITEEIIQQVEREAAAVRGVYEDLEKQDLGKKNAIAVTDELRQGFIDVGLAASRGADDAADALGNLARRIADTALELYALKPLMEWLFGQQGNKGGGAIGSIIASIFGGGGMPGFNPAGTAGASSAGGLPAYSPYGFASGTANTGGRRGEVRGVVHGQEAVIPLPSGGKVPVNLQMPPSLMAGAGGGGTSIQVINNTPSKVETQTSRGSDGREIVQFVISEVKKEFAGGGFDKAQAGRYGVKPTGVRR